MTRFKNFVSADDLRNAFKDLASTTRQSGSALKDMAFAEGIRVHNREILGFNGHNHSDKSLMDGISSPEAMTHATARKGWGGIGLTDHGSMGGVLKAGKAAKEWSVLRYLKTGHIFTAHQLTAVSSAVAMQAYQYSHLNLTPNGYVFTVDPTITHFLHISGNSFPKVYGKIIADKFYVTPAQTYLDARSRGEDLSSWSIVDIIKDLPKFTSTICLPSGLTLDAEALAELKLMADKHLVTYDPSEPRRLALLKDVPYSTEGVHKPTKTNVSVVSQKQLKTLDSSWALTREESELYVLDWSLRTLKPIMKSEFSPSPFKAVSGCEFYVSWARTKINGGEDKYNHITLYALGEKGHRALILLSNIGSIESRKYTNGSTTRPRIFVEDIETAISIAGEEIVVTTGCPISITSEALRRDDHGAVTEFLDWAVRVVHKGNLFIELHLTDVSFDWNYRHALAEGTFWASSYGTPISRFRFGDYKDAISHARKFQGELRGTFLKTLMSSYKKKHDGSADSKISGDRLEHLEMLGMVDRNSLMTEGVVKPLLGLGISKTLFDVLSMEEVMSANAADEESSAQAEMLLLAAKIAEESPDKIKGRKDSKRRRGQSLVAISGSKKVALLDEEDLELLRVTERLLEVDERHIKNSEAKILARTSKGIASIVRYIVTRLARDESLSEITVAGVLSGIFSINQLVTAKPQLSPYPEIFKNDSEALGLLATQRFHGLDAAVDLISRFSHEDFVPSVNDQVVMQVFIAASRCFFSVFETSGALEVLNPKLGPSAGEEDELEKEWLINSEGNWLEKINEGLVHYSKVYDIPLMLGMDAHMTEAQQKHVQDVIIKRGKRRAWYFSLPYAIGRAEWVGLIEDLGHGAISSGHNSAVKMLNKGIIALEDIVESIGGGAMMLAKATSVGSFKWDPAVPKIPYVQHPYYAEATELLASGRLRSILPLPGSGAMYEFTDETINLPSAFLCIFYQKAVEQQIIPHNDIYWERFLKEMHVVQQAPPNQLADFILCLEFIFHKLRSEGVSLGPGRGSSGSMLLAFIAGITFTDPVKKGFISERWITAGRKNNGADADMDVDLDDRLLGGKIIAMVQRDAFFESVRERPLDALERILHAETFYSPNGVDKGIMDIGVRESLERMQRAKAILQNPEMAAKYFSEITSGSVRKQDSVVYKMLSKGEGQENDSDEFDTLSVRANTDDTIFNTPVMRVGTYGAFRPKNAVKDAVRMLDQTAFDDLDPYVEATPDYRTNNAEKLAGLSTREVNVMFENETKSKESFRTRIEKRRVKLGDKLSKEMTANSGTVTEYKSEIDFFDGAVYGKQFDYWNPTKRAPTGSEFARRYFQKNPEVEKLVREMLTVNKSAGVHAGGFCFGREVFERIPGRVDAIGFVSLYDMKDIEAVRILKFDFLGLETLSVIRHTLTLMINELDYDKYLAWWIPKDVYLKVKAGASTDYLWPFIPKSTNEAAYTMMTRRALIFQIGTPVFARLFQRMDYSVISAKIAERGDPMDPNNDALVDYLDALLAVGRPGPMELKTDIEYVDRYHGQAYEQIHPWVSKFLGTTFDRPIYQEQVQKIWQHAAIDLDENGKPILDEKGNVKIASGEDADEVRRAMGKKAYKALADIRAEPRFMAGIQAQGVPLDIAQNVWDLLVKFVAYGFNHPHSHNYAHITQKELFLKAFYESFFMRVGLAHADWEDAAKYIGEISTFMQMPCVIRSSEFYWEINNQGYFPGLNAIEKLNKNDIEAIIKAKQFMVEKINAPAPAIFQMTPDEKASAAQFFFYGLGRITTVFARVLAHSGILRAFGEGEIIAEAYRQALLLRKRELIDQTVEATADDGLSNDNAIEGMPKTGKRAKSKKKENSWASLTTMETGIIELFKTEMVEWVAPGIMSLRSAYNVTVTNKLKGQGIETLTKSLKYFEGEVEGKHELRLLSEFLQLDPSKLPRNGVTARAVAFPESVRSAGTSKDGRNEFRLVLRAEGDDLKGKYNIYDKSEIDVENDVQLLQKKALKEPLIFTITAKSFKNDKNEMMNFYKIESFEYLPVGKATVKAVVAAELPPEVET
ncbi:MAG: PHP domain-containing protein [Pedobacter sp.]|nr:MAG: PHP domain-containing protein [Pedobacter sp.]